VNIWRGEYCTFYIIWVKSLKSPLWSNWNNKGWFSNVLLSVSRIPKLIHFKPTACFYLIRCSLLIHTFNYISMAAAFELQIIAAGRYSMHLLHYRCTYCITDAPIALPKYKLLVAAMFGNHTGTAIYTYCQCNCILEFVGILTQCPAPFHSRIVLYSWVTRYASCYSLAEQKSSPPMHFPKRGQETKFKVQWLRSWTC